MLGGSHIFEKDDVESIYLRLINNIKKKDLEALKTTKGIPDASNLSVEFKFYIDWLRADQIILDILGGRKSKVRWVSSYDELEKILRGEKNTSILFDSYLHFMIMCEKTKQVNFSDLIEKGELKICK